MTLPTDEKVDRIALTLRAGGAAIPLEMSVPSDSVKLGRMLPILRQLSNSFIAGGLEGLPEGGREVSCRAGCGACCRQIVPISEAEAFDLRELIDSMPEPRRTEVAARFAHGFAKLKEAGFFERLSTAAEDRENDAEYNEAVREYFRFGIACPFLENDSCSIHERRPITCREYLVTSPPENCATAEGDGVTNVHHFFQVKEALISLSRDRTAPHLPYVPMIALVEWTNANRDDSPEHTGREWAQLFFSKLTEFSRPPAE